MKHENLIDAEEQSNDDIMKGFNFIKEVGSPYSFKENKMSNKIRSKLFWLLQEKIYSF